MHNVHQCNAMYFVLYSAFYTSFLNFNCSVEKPVAVQTPRIYHRARLFLKEAWKEVKFIQILDFWNFDLIYAMLCNVDVNYGLYLDK